MALPLDFGRSNAHLEVTPKHMRGVPSDLNSTVFMPGAPQAEALFVHFSSLPLLSPYARGIKSSACPIFGLLSSLASLVQ